MNDITSHLTPLLYKSLASRYMIIVKNITNEILKKKIIKLINYYRGNRPSRTYLCTYWARGPIREH